MWDVRWMVAEPVKQTIMLYDLKLDRDANIFNKSEKIHCCFLMKAVTARNKSSNENTSCDYTGRRKVSHHGGLRGDEYAGNEVASEV